MFLHTLPVFFQNAFPVHLHCQNPVPTYTLNPNTAFFQKLQRFPLPSLFSSAESACFLSLSLSFFVYCNLHFSHSTNYNLYSGKPLHFPVYFKFYRDRDHILLKSVCSIVFKNTVYMLHKLMLNWDVTF